MASKKQLEYSISQQWPLSFFFFMSDVNFPIVGCLKSTPNPQVVWGGWSGWMGRPPENLAQGPCLANLA